MYSTAASLFLSGLDAAVSLTTADYVAEALFGSEGDGGSEKWDILEGPLALDPRLTLRGLLLWTTILLGLYVVRMMAGAFLFSSSSYSRQTVLAFADLGVLLAAVGIIASTRVQSESAARTLVIIFRVFHALAAGAADMANYHFHQRALPSKSLQSLISGVASVALLAGIGSGIVTPCILRQSQADWEIAYYLQATAALVVLSRRAWLALGLGINRNTAVLPVSVVSLQHLARDPPSAESTKEQLHATFASKSKRLLTSVGSFASLAKGQALVLAVTALLAAAWVAEKFQSWLLFVSLLQLLTLVSAICSGLPESLKNSWLESCPTVMLFKWAAASLERAKRQRRGQRAKFKGQLGDDSIGVGADGDDDEDDWGGRDEEQGHASGRGVIKELSAHVLALDARVSSLVALTTGNRDLSDCRGRGRGRPSLGRARVLSCNSLSRSSRKLTAGSGSGAGSGAREPSRDVSGGTGLVSAGSSSGSLGALCLGLSFGGGGRKSIKSPAKRGPSAKAAPAPVPAPIPAPSAAAAPTAPEPATEPNKPTPTPAPASVDKDRPPPAASTHDTAVTTSATSRGELEVGPGVIWGAWAAGAAGAAGALTSAGGALGLWGGGGGGGGGAAKISGSAVPAEAAPQCLSPFHIQEGRVAGGPPRTPSPGPGPGPGQVVPKIGNPAVQAGQEGQEGQAGQVPNAVLSKTPHIPHKPEPPTPLSSSTSLSFLVTSSQSTCRSFDSLSDGRETSWSALDFTVMTDGYEEGEGGGEEGQRDHGASRAGGERGGKSIEKK